MKPSINLATHGHINRRALYAVYGLIGLLLLVWLVGQIADWRASYMQSRILHQRITELEGQLGMDKSAKPVSAEQFTAQLQEIRFSNRVIARDSYRWSQLLSSLEDVLPEDVRITSIHPQFKEGTILLRGAARDVEDLQAFLDRLQESTEFRDVLLLEQARQDPGRGAAQADSVLTFGIQVRRGDA